MLYDCFMFAVVGLGNPGKKYEDTRHNVGRLAVESMSDEFMRDKIANALVAPAQVGNESAALILPETFMNKSGESVRKFVPERVEVGNLVVAYDDLALPFGEIKVSFGKGSGGHNGVQNIIDQLRTKDFIRVRIGIAPTGVIAKFLKGKNVDFVLKPFSKKESDQLNLITRKTREAIEMIIKEGKERAMNEFN